jgi:hypothetical protein
MEDPGAYLSGTVALTATANSTAGITSVRIDRAPSGTTTWTAVCTDTTAPYGCSLDTTTLTDGLYDFRAVLVDKTGKTTISSTVSGRRVDNSPLRAYDVQTVNGGTSGRLDTGDQLRFTFTEQATLSSISSGWTGAAQAVTIRMRDGVLVGNTGSGDVVDVLKGNSVLPLGSVNMGGNYIKSRKTVTFNATMVASTTTVGTQTATVVTITVGSLAGGGGQRTFGSPSTMVWTPTTTILDLSNQPCSNTPATERGVADKDF